MKQLKLTNVHKVLAPAVLGAEEVEACPGGSRDIPDHRRIQQARSSLCSLVRHAAKGHFHPAQIPHEPAGSSR